MLIQLLVTQNDFNRANIEHEFKDLGVRYQVDFVEEHPELVSAFNIRHTPTIIVDGRLVFRYQPSEKELRDYFLKVGVLH